MRQQEALEQISFMRQLVEDTRLIVASGYPFFILWGLVWIAGYGSQALLDQEGADRAWQALIFGAVVAQFGIIALSRRKPGWGSTSLTKKLFRINLVLLVALLAIPLLFGAEGAGLGSGIVERGSTPDIPLYIPFWVGLIYIVNGVFLGREMVLIGGWIIVAVVVATFLTDDAASYWMAAAGGGSLVATGLLLRSTYRAATRAA